MNLQVGGYQMLCSRYGAVGAPPPSYKDLPSHLKQFFLYYFFSTKVFLWYKDIAPFWVAKSLIVERKGRLMEDVADEYCGLVLVWRNLLQVDSIFFFAWPSTISLSANSMSLSWMPPEDEGGGEGKVTSLGNSSLTGTSSWTRNQFTYPNWFKVLWGQNWY